jgi:hypothetical protein
VAGGNDRWGSDGEVYAKNSRLELRRGVMEPWILNLDGAMNALVRGLGLRVADTFVYTPQPLAFADPTGASQFREAFVQGIQVQRVNSFTNTAKADASYFFSPFVGVISTYTDQRRRFLQPIAPPTGVPQRGIPRYKFPNSDFRACRETITVRHSPTRSPVSESHFSRS